MQIIGVPDEKYGEEICALIKLQSELSREEILEYMKDQIAHYKIPKYVKFVESLPITVTGKPQKFKMREEWVEEAEKSDMSQYLLKK